MLHRRLLLLPLLLLLALHRSIRRLPPLPRWRRCKLRLEAPRIGVGSRQPPLLLPLPRRQLRSGQARRRRAWGCKRRKGHRPGLPQRAQPRPRLPPAALRRRRQLRPGGLLLQQLRLCSPPTRRGLRLSCRQRGTLCRSRLSLCRRGHCGCREVAARGCGTPQGACTSRRRRRRRRNGDVVGACCACCPINLCPQRCLLLEAQLLQLREHGAQRAQRVEEGVQQRLRGMDRDKQGSGGCQESKRLCSRIKRLHPYPAPRQSLLIGAHKPPRRSVQHPTGASTSLRGTHLVRCDAAGWVVAQQVQHQVCQAGIHRSQLGVQLAARCAVLWWRQPQRAARRRRRCHALLQLGRQRSRACCCCS